MNNARLWLVVNPTVGIPIFLGAVAVGSFSVHVAVLTNTTWVADFLAGRELGSTASIEAPAALASASERVAVEAAQPSVTVDEASQTATIVLPDGRTAEVVLDRPVEIASAEAL